MEEPEVSKQTEGEVEDEKRNAGPERVPDVVIFTSAKSLWTAFVLIWLTKFLMLLIDGAVLNLTPRVSPHDSAHSVFSILPMILGISSGILRLPMAKCIDRIGRGYGLVMTVAISIAGLLVLTAAPCPEVAVVGRIYWVIASSCLDFIFTVVLADMTSLKNRALIYGVYATPVFFTTFATAAMEELLYSQVHWRKAFGICFGIWFIWTCLVLCVIGSAYDHESSATTTAEKRRFCDCLKRAVIELDIPGIILAIAGLCLFLLPLSHYPGTQDGWPTNTFYVMSIIGPISLMAFVVWEHGMYPVTCFPWRLMGNRNLFGGCLVVFFSSVSIAHWAPYYSPFLQVVHDQTIPNANQITLARVLASSIAAPLLGHGIRMTGDYKYHALSAGTILALTTGLLLAYGNDTSPIALALSQDAIGFAETFLLGCSQMAVMADFDHEYVASALAIWGAFLSVAVALGSTGATALWTRDLQAMLEDALPVDSKNLLGELMGSLEKQKQYPLGSPIRDAVIAAYWSVQKQTVGAAVFLIFLAFVSIFLWMKIDLRKRKDVQGARSKGVIW